MFESFFVILVIRINDVNSCQPWSIVEFSLLVFPFLFSRFWAALQISVHTSGHTWSGLVVVWTLGSVLPAHIYPLGGFSFNRVKLLETCPRIWQASVRIDVPTVIRTFLLHDVQISVSRPCYINVFQWKRECFFLRHIELNSKFMVMTTDEVTLNRPEVRLGFSLICWFCRLTLSSFTLKFTTEICAPFGLFPPQSGFPEMVVSVWQFCCTICYWGYDFISFLWYQNFPSSMINFWCVQLIQVFLIRNHNISFPNPSRDQLIPTKDTK